MSARRILFAFQRTTVRQPNYLVGIAAPRKYILYHRLVGQYGEVLQIVRAGVAVPRIIGRDSAELSDQAREEALRLMIEEARKLGGNAVVATRLATSQVMGQAAEVLAYGTACVIE